MITRTARRLIAQPRILLTALGCLALAGGAVRAQVTVRDLQRDAESVTLQWQGGHGPYVVEAMTPDGRWSAQGEPVAGATATLPGFASRGVYRIIDVDPESSLGGAFGLIQTGQGEFGSLFGRHRLKTRLWFYKTTGAPHTSGSFTAAEYFRKLLVVRQYLDSGRVLTWTGPLESLGTVTQPTNSRLAVNWSDGSGAALRTFSLSLTFPYTITSIRTAAPLPSDPAYDLKCTYASPQPELDYDGAGIIISQTTTQENTALYELNPQNPDAEFPAPRKYTVNDRGARVDLHFHEGVPLIEGSPPWIWKTFILDRWLSPTTGGGGTLPAFSTDSWFARTLQPGHHNFIETVLLEPALDPALSEVTRSALLTANIRYVYAFKDLDIGVGNDDIRFIGFDNALHSP